MNLEKYRIKIYTRSMNKALYERAMFFLDLPYPKIRLLNTSADGYLYQLVEDTEADIIINIDEDAFVYDLSELKKLLYYMIENDYVNCGMPDGGVAHLRRANPLVTNPFFNILNVAAIRNKFSKEAIESFPYHRAEYMDGFPDKLLRIGYEFVNNEPYCHFFVWLSQNFKTLYLDSADHPDGESTILKNHMGIPFLIHTWYSRMYNTDRKHTKRINNVVKECSGLSGLKYPVSVKENISSFALIQMYQLQRFLVKLKKRLLKNKKG